MWKFRKNICEGIWRSQIPFVYLQRKYKHNITHMKKVAIKVVKEVKVDGRKNNTGRPVNTNSARQIRLNKQKATKHPQC